MRPLVHLTGLEVEKLLAATKGARHETRNRCLILLIVRDGLRVAEAVRLKLSDVDLEGRTLHVTRLKCRSSTTYLFRGDELRVWKAWLSTRACTKTVSKALFLSERRQPLSRQMV